MAIVIHLMSFVVPSSYIDNDEYTVMSAAAKISFSLIPNINLWYIQTNNLYIGAGCIRLISNKNSCSLELVFF